MRYLSKIIFLNSAHIPYAEVKLDGNVHFIGTQGVGKSTLLRAILFFYNADKLRLGIPKEKKSFDAFYFPYANSYIVYEVERENGAYCVVALKSQGRVMYRFIDAPYDSRWFLDDRRQVYSEWNKIRTQIGTKAQISSLVSSYEMFRDIIFGNNRRHELLAYRKFAIVESAKYQNIPRTIQNVFLNTKLDADFIKDTIICSMSDEIQFIDLTFYREQIKKFEQEYNDVSLWTTKNRNGEIAIRHMADKVIGSYRSLLNNRRLIRDGRRELNHAERMAVEALPRQRVQISDHELECNRLLRLKSEEQEKHEKERDLLTREIAVIDDRLKRTAEKRKYYAEKRIDDILRRAEQEPVLEEERKRQEAMKAELERSYRDVVEKYKVLLDKLDMDLRAYKNDAGKRTNEHQAAFFKAKGKLMDELRKTENDVRMMSKSKIDAATEVVYQLDNEANALKIKKAKLSNENPFAKELEAVEQEKKDLLDQKRQTEAAVRELEQHIEAIRHEAESELKIAELLFQGRLTEAQQQKDNIDAEIARLKGLLEKSEGSFADWLDKNKSDWQENVGKVVDEETVLYNTELNPQLLGQATDSLYGVSVNLAAVERKFRTPAELKNQLDEKESERANSFKLLNEMQRQHSNDTTALNAKYQAKIKKVNESIRELKALLMMMPQQEKNLDMRALDLSKKLEDWRNEQLSILEEELNATTAKKMKQEEARTQLEAALQRKLKALQTDYNHKVKAENESLDRACNDIKRQVAEKERQAEERKNELLNSQRDELHGKGMDTTALDSISKHIAELTHELSLIHKNRIVVAGYFKDKEELFDKEQEARLNRKLKAEAQALLESKFSQRREKLNAQLGAANDKLSKLKEQLKALESGLSAVKNFRDDANLCPSDSHDESEKPTTKGCTVIVNELKSLILTDSQSLGDFKRQSQQFLGQFSPGNTFNFNVSPVTEEEFFAFAINLCEFVDNDKISEYQQRISDRYADILRRISKEMGDLMSREGDIKKTIIDINRDFEERNFAGVIREIALRPVQTSDQLVLLLQRIKEFADENEHNMGEIDLFSTESRQEVNAKAVKHLMAFMKRLLDEPNRKQLQVADTFKLEFRIKENDNDTGWVEKIANVGSDGTDILVKAMVNIMLINVFKEKASKKSGDFKIHCMMDEIGKLHPNNVKGILDFANRRNILLVNSSPTTYNVEDYKYTYLLSKDGRANTKVVQLIKRLS